MRAGKLRNRVTIQSPGQGVDDFGMPTQQTWADVDTVWAEIKPITGRERWASDWTANIATVAVSMRYRSDIKPNYRVIFGDRVLRIAGPPINVDQRNRELILTCEEVTN